MDFALYLIEMIALVFIVPFVVAKLATKYLFKQSKKAFGWILAVMIFTMFYVVHRHEVSFLGYLDSILVHLAKFVPAYLLAHHIYGRVRHKFSIWLFYVLWMLLWTLNIFLVEAILDYFGIKVW